MSNIGKEYTWDYCITKLQKKPYLEFSEIIANFPQKDRKTAAGLCLHNYKEVPYFGEEKHLQDEGEVSIICANCKASYCTKDCFPKNNEPDVGGCSHVKTRVDVLAVEKKKEPKQGSEERGWDFNYRDWDFDQQDFKEKPKRDPAIIARLVAREPNLLPFVCRIIDDEDDILMKQQEETGKRVLTSTLKLQRPLLVKIAEVQSPSEFYVIPVDKGNYDSEVAQMKAACKLAAKKQNILENPQVNHDCLAWRQDDDWNLDCFRARVLHILPDSIYVKFLDTGEVASIPPKDLRILPDELCETPPLVIKVGLAQAREGQFQCNEMQLAAFRRRTKRKCCIFTPYEYDDISQCYFGSLLTSDDRDIFSTLFRTPTDDPIENVE